eukprot:m.488857 g.488857  ORF g.488857 m.488857 type:complete len:384 (+) comp26156_c0_seq1:66-1217(+)
MAMSFGSLLLFGVVVVGCTVCHAADGNWTKVLLTDAATQGAVCLDGSPGGYYIRHGVGANADKWIVFHQGGGWCGSDLNCAARAKTGLGSSNNWPSTYTDVYEGSQLFSTEPFSEFTIVYAMYCDGSSWTGNVASPVHTNDPKQPVIYYRGRLLLDAMLNNLREAGLGKASELIYAGCSAGGLTAYLHLDYVREQFPEIPHVVGLADAMFSLEYSSFAGVPQFPRIMAWGFSAWNSTGSVSKACQTALGGGQHCMFGGALAQFVQTPLFVINSKYDSWQQKAIIGVDCSIQACNSTIQAYWTKLAQKMVTAFQALPPRHGGILSNCEAHCQTGIPNWTTLTVDGHHMGASFAQWYAAQMAGGTKTPMRYAETCDVKPCGHDTC